MADIEKLGMKKLDTDNYATWAVKMRFLLVTKDMWSAVTVGTDGDGHVNVVTDAKALALIGLCVEDYHLAFPTAPPPYVTVTSCCSGRTLYINSMLQHMC
mgnify:CR=1 FL=1